MVVKDKNIKKDVVSDEVSDKVEKEVSVNKKAIVQAHRSIAKFNPYEDLSGYIRMVKSIPRLTQEEELDLAHEMIEKKSVNAAQKLIESNLYLVASVAYKYKGYRLPMADIISQGNIGLMQAVKKFDPEKGFRLSTYAVWWIKAEIQDYIMNSWSDVKINKSLANKTLFFNFNKKLKEAGVEYKGYLSDEQVRIVADYYNVKAEEIREIEQRRNYNGSSLNDRVGGSGEGDSVERIDLIASNYEGQEERVERKSEVDLKRKILSEFILTLNDNEKRILKGRFVEDPQETLQDLGDELSISKERVRQIEVAIKSKLQKFAREKFDYKAA